MNRRIAKKVSKRVNSTDVMVLDRRSRSGMNPPHSDVARADDVLGNVWWRSVVLNSRRRAWDRFTGADVLT